ncbi:hypothetical protein [Halomarina oriensis]|uniref:Uncharacterized protein n=1 Tax=Halomarina oriensis TaxID=671145 RepID=A0A6B0GN39_9EURY|nr:hypothetical protein [Halomarina oriensis]MWG34909.1 hypothetical protein [Halomarina oriensis]
MNPLQAGTPVPQVPQNGPDPLWLVSSLVLGLVAASLSFLGTYLLVRFVLVGLATRTFDERAFDGRVVLAAKALAFCDAVVAGTFGLLVTGVGSFLYIPRWFLTVSLGGTAVFVLAMGTVRLERALGSRGLA